MYLHKDYDVRAVPRYLPIYHQVQYLDQQIDAIAKGKYFSRKRLDKQLEKATDGFSRILKQSELLTEKMNGEKKNREMEESRFVKDLETSAKTAADITEVNWRERMMKKEIEGIKEFNVDSRLRDRLVENNMKAFDRLQIIKGRQ